MQSTKDFFTPLTPGVQILSLVLLGLFSLFATQNLYAQTDLAVTGTVYDDTGAPLMGAVVRHVGTNRGAATDIDGHFRINIPDPSGKSAVKIIVSFMGMRTQTVTWHGKPLEIHLKADVKELAGVSVTARPNINDIDIRSRSGVVHEVDMKLLQETPTIDFMTALQGNVPGLVIVNRGELGVKPEVRLRGNTSFRKGDSPNEPLYVLDGQVISSETFLTINPLDILEIRVLKDAVANALYGVKAANGVLEITSKRGTPGPLSISFSSNVGITFRGKRPIPMMKTPEKLEFERRTKALTAPGYLLSTDIFEQERFSDIQRVYREVYDFPISSDMAGYKAFAKEELAKLKAIETDWFLELMRPNVYHSHNLSLRGGNDEVVYYVSGNFTEQGGQLPGNKVWRGTLRTSIDWTVQDLGFITLSTNLGYSRTHSPNSSTYSPQQMVETLNPYETRESKRLYSYPGRKYSDIVNQYRSSGNNARVGTTVGLNFKLLDVLRMDGVVGVDYLLHTRENITPYYADSQKRIGKRPTEMGEISYSKDNELNATSNFRLTYNQVFDDKHDLTFSANTDYYYTYGHALTAKGHGIGAFESLAGVNKSLTNAYRPDFTSSVTRIAQLGIGLATGYTYDAKADVFASYKADATNLLPKEKRWNSAWAIGAGIHLVPLFWKEKPDVLSTLSLKASYGHTASLGGVSAALTVPIFRYNQSSYYGDYFRHLGLAEMYNLDLRPEKVHSIDLGLTLGIIGDRHQLNTQLYRRTTVDALLMVSIPSSNGFKTMMQNVGILRNEGVEVSLSDTWLSTQDFTLSSRLSLAYNSNQVIDLYDGPALYSSDDAVIPDYEEGKPYDLVYGFDAIGIHPLTGYPMYRDREGNEKRFTLNPRRSDLITLGHSTPPYQGTVGLSAQYRDFRLEMQLYYVFGGVKAYRSNIVREKTSAHKNAVEGQLHRTWFGEGDDGKLYPSPNYDTGVLFYYHNSRMIAPSDYLRLSTLSLYYSIPHTFLEKSLSGYIKYASLGLQASNLFTISPYRGSNPEAGVHDTGLQPVLTMNLILNF